MTPNRPHAALIAPTGRLRAAINLANPVLCSGHTTEGEVAGLAADISLALGRWLDVDTELVTFDSARRCVTAVLDEDVDVSFFAMDPARGQEIHFTPPYIQMEGIYVVPDSSPIATIADVDRPGYRIAVGAGSAYALFLARKLKYAQVIEVPTSPEVVDTFVRNEYEAAAGVRRQIQRDAANHQPGLRILEQPFMAIHQSLAIKKRRGDLACSTLNEFIEDIKAAGFIAHALQSHGIAGPAIAPAGYPVIQH